MDRNYCLTDNTGKRTHTYAYGPTGLPRLRILRERVLSALVCNGKGDEMSKVGWTMEQRAVVKRYTLVAGIFTFVAVAFAVFLIGSGNPGGWVLIAMAGVAMLVLSRIWLGRRSD
ncbi:hypothetical protein SUDANB140_06151 [Streptomyces sp. enrichment culture]